MRRICDEPSLGVQELDDWPSYNHLHSFWFCRCTRFHTRATPAEGYEWGHCAARNLEDLGLNLLMNSDHALTHHKLREVGLQLKIRC